MKGQLALALSLSPFVIRSRGFQLSPDLQKKACYCGGRRSGKKNTLHGSTPISRSTARADSAGTWGDSSMRGAILERDFGALATEVARKKLIQLLSGEKLLLLVFQSLLGFGIAF